LKSIPPQLRKNSPKKAFLCQRRYVESIVSVFYQANHKSYAQSVEATKTKKKASAKARNNAKTKKVKKTAKKQAGNNEDNTKNKTEGGDSNDEEDSKKELAPAIITRMRTSSSALLGSRPLKMAEKKRIKLAMLSGPLLPSTT
jgi:hypothetical protein